MNAVPVGRCVRCRAAWHPAPPVCPRCRGRIVDATVAGPGTVVSWTRVARPPEGFPAPQRIVLVSLQDPEHDAEVTVLAAASEAALRIGTTVDVTIAGDGRLVATTR